VGANKYMGRSEDLGHGMKIIDIRKREKDASFDFLHLYFDQSINERIRWIHTGCYWLVGCRSICI
jgi:hypothetical protein